MSTLADLVYSVVGIQGPQGPPGTGFTMYTPTVITGTHTIANSGEQFVLITNDVTYDVTLPATGAVADGYTIYISDLPQISSHAANIRTLIAQGSDHIYLAGSDWNQSIPLGPNICMSAAFTKHGNGWYAIAATTSTL